MTMADAGAAVATDAAAATAGGAARGGVGGMIFGVVRSVAMYYVISSFLKGAVNKPNGMGADVDPAAAATRVGGGADAGGGPLASGPGGMGGGRAMARPLYVKGEEVDVWAYITNDPIFTQYGDSDFMVAHEERIPLCGIPAAGAAGTPADSGEREYRVVHLLTEEDLARNATPHLHVFFTRPGAPHDPNDDAYSPRDVFGGSMPLVKYFPKRKISTKKNLLGQSAAGESEGDEDSVGGVGGAGGGAAAASAAAAEAAGAGEVVGELAGEATAAEVAEFVDDGQWLPFFKPNVTVSLIDDFNHYPPGGIPPQMKDLMMFDPESGRYFPTVYMNEFWLLRNYLVPLNGSLPAVNLTLTVSPLSLWRWQVMEQMEKTFETQRAMGTAGENDSDELKRVLLEGNPYLLVLTGVVSMFHTVFDMLAFKNDIGFWKQNKSMEGLSARTIVFNAVCQLVIFLYLLDNDTSWMVLISSGLGLLIEMWKITKAMDVSLTAAFPFVRVKDKHGYHQSDTAKHDEVAMRYLSYALYPLVGCYAVYSVVYNEHKGWYSFVLTTLVGAVYLFGFITMCPQLYINYKLKSVAHLPWRQMTYKFLNTIIDDLFAFVIKMPLMHRLSVFRDDVVFLIMLYQRWIYKVDKSRVNEFGFSGEAPTGTASPDIGKLRLGDKEGEGRAEGEDGGDGREKAAETKKEK